MKNKQHLQQVSNIRTFEYKAIHTNNHCIVTQDSQFESVSQLFLKKEETYNWPHEANVDGKAK